MNILVIDDEKMVLEDICDTIQKVKPEARLFRASTYTEAIEIAEKNSLDIAFSDIEMPVMNGLELSKRLKVINPKLNIIFVTAYSEYAIDAFSMYVSGYLLKPVSEESIRVQFDNLRHPIIMQKSDKLTVKCFGNFEVFKDGEPVIFERNKTKELFAYLIDRKGSVISAAELCAVLWEDEENSGNKKVYLQKLKKDLTNTLKKLGEEKVFITSYNKYAINTEEIYCDYYEFLSNNPEAIKAYNGEYMMQYSWSEYTAGLLGIK